MVKHARYAGLRPSASENAPMNAGARPWKIYQIKLTTAGTRMDGLLNRTIYEVTVKLISVFETRKSAANVVSDG